MMQSMPRGERQSLIRFKARTLAARLPAEAICLPETPGFLGWSGSLNFLGEAKIETVQFREIAGRRRDVTLAS